MATFHSVGEYLDSFPEDVRQVLVEIRRRIHEAVPGAEDAISYDIPAVRVNGRTVVHFAGWKEHVSLYPVPPTGAASGDPDLAADLAPYVAGKGTVKFSLVEPIPYELVSRVAAALARAHDAEG